MSDETIPVLHAELPDEAVNEIAERLAAEDWTEGEAAILERLERLETKVDAMLAVFEQLSGLMEGLQGKGLLDLIRGR